jgi:hypothetical protein
MPSVGLANMRENGVRSLAVQCHRRRHEVIMKLRCRWWRWARVREGVEAPRPSVQRSWQVTSLCVELPYGSPSMTECLQCPPETGGWPACATNCTVPIRLAQTHTICSGGDPKNQGFKEL